MANGERTDDTGRAEKPASNHTSLKAAIVQAAIELGTELGEEGLTMRGIAARLGVSATALYQHFEGKASILQAIRFHGLQMLNSELAPAFSLDDPIDQLRRSAVFYIGFARSNPWLYKLLFEGEDVDYSTFSPEELAVMGSSKHAAQKAFERAKEAGVLRADLEMSTVTQQMWACNHGLSMLLITGRLSETQPYNPVVDIEAFITRFVEAVLRGYMPDPA